MSFRQFVRLIAVKFKLPLTQNLAYDFRTEKIMKRVLQPTSNCIDIGCHLGEIMDEILKLAPDGRHFAFEPLPHLFKQLESKFGRKPVTLFSCALYDKKGTTTFNYVVNAPAYSGIRKRQYDIPDAEINELTVDTDLLDHLIPEDVKIDFIKIDVEGAEFPVLKGGVRTIQRSKPVVIFEFGLGAADFYGSKPDQLFSFFTETCQLKVNTLKGFLFNSQALSATEFTELYQNRKEYYFISYP